MQLGVLKYSKLKEWILKFFSLATQQRLDRLLSFPAQLEQQTLSRHHKFGTRSTASLPFQTERRSTTRLNCGGDAFHRPAVRTNTTSSMAHHGRSEDQLVTNPTTDAVWSSNVRPVHHQQPSDKTHKQPSQLMKLKDGVYGYHRRYEDGAFKCAPGCTYKPKN